MAANPVIQPSSEFRETFFSRGGEGAARCYQCATCSSVCELAPAEAPFPRQQMLWAQWGLVDRLVGDPGVWLCYQCNDCSVRCPRDVAPGDVMAVARGMVVERLATPSFLGKLVGNIKKTWPLLVLGPIIFWLILLGATTGLHIPGVDGNLPALEGRFHYEHFVPHSLIYIVYFSAVALVCFALAVSGFKFWKMLGDRQPRAGSFIGAMIGVVVAIAFHTKFSSCDRGVLKRRWGHFLLMWGFIGAAITSGFAVVYLYKDTVFFSWLNLSYTYPMPITHWVKWLGNISAAALVVGGILLFVNRLKTGDKLVGATTPFDRFFLWVVLAVIGTGVFTELFRFMAAPPVLGCAIYVIHLGVVLCLFLTLPYSKFAHIVYRTLAMAHERMTTKETT
ncbi:MAG: quinone-interacting membrane-bound oxidoreductase complex subunit QmoC [Acidobacteria bacterium]|nr:quinone-interacting membrane-bound oxidoreductase complex subunit QmoC [Acidobacteriota bacterium]